MRLFPMTTLVLSQIHLPRVAVQPASTPQVASLEVIGSIKVQWARQFNEVEQALRLRHEVLVDELGDRTTAPLAIFDDDLLEDCGKHLLLTSFLEPLICSRAVF